MGPGTWVLDDPMPLAVQGGSYQGSLPRYKGALTLLVGPAYLCCRDGSLWDLPLQGILG